MKKRERSDKERTTSQKRERSKYVYIHSFSEKIGMIDFNKGGVVHVYNQKGGTNSMRQKREK